jgi:DNA polymerase III psi subunit
MSRAVDHLAAMGLTRWVRRELLATSSDQTASERVETLAEGETPVATVIVVADAGFRLDAGEPAGALLMKILAALDVPLSRLRILRIDALQALGSATQAPGPLLAFVGDAAVAPEGALVLPSLSEMLADPSRKRPAWERLRPLVGKLGR